MPMRRKSGSAPTSNPFCSGKQKSFFFRRASVVSIRRSEAVHLPRHQLQLCWPCRGVSRTFGPTWQHCEQPFSPPLDIFEPIAVEQNMPFSFPSNISNLTPPPVSTFVQSSTTISSPFNPSSSTGCLRSPTPRVSPAVRLSSLETVLALRTVGFFPWYGSNTDRIYRGKRVPPLRAQLFRRRIPLDKQWRRWQS